MRTTTRTVLLTLAISVTLAAIVSFCLVRFVLPTKMDSLTAPPAYTIGVWEGKLAVFEGTDSYPMQIFDTDIAGLPDEQRSQVEQGVRVDKAEELYLVLEDYTG